MNSRHDGREGEEEKEEVEERGGNNKTVGMGILDFYTISRARVTVYQEYQY